MRFIHICVAVLCVVAFGQSAPVTDCDRLIQPVDIKGRDQVLGKWTLLAETTNIPRLKNLTKSLVQSSWTKLTAGNESHVIHVLQGEKMFGSCFTLRSNMTLENNTFSMGPPFNASVRLLSTGCPDCLVLHLQALQDGEIHSGVQLMSRRTKVTAAELGEFKKQVECLKLPAPDVLIPKNGLCPEESLLNTDLTDIIQTVNLDTLKQLDSLLDNIVNSMMDDDEDLESLMRTMSSIDLPMST